MTYRLHKISAGYFMFQIKTLSYTHLQSRWFVHHNHNNVFSDMNFWTCHLKGGCHNIMRVTISNLNILILTFLDILDGRWWALLLCPSYIQCKGSAHVKYNSQHAQDDHSYFTIAFCAQGKNCSFSNNSELHKKLFKSCWSWLLNPHLEAFD